jgi:hypothetical protein
MIASIIKAALVTAAAISIAAFGGPEIQKLTQPYMPCVYFKLHCSLNSK